MKPPLVILGCGNPSRGDDALGPLLCDRLSGWGAGAGEDASFEVFQDFQFQVEHALDIVGRDLVLFIDAAVGLDAPFAFTRIGSRADVAHTTHALTPQAVLSVYVQLHERHAPPAYLLRVRGESFGLGAPPAAHAAAALDAAWDMLQRLVGDATESAWDRLTSRDLC